MLDFAPINIWKVFSLAETINFDLKFRVESKTDFFARPHTSGNPYYKGGYTIKIFSDIFVVIKITYFRGERRGGRNI